MTTTKGWARIDATRLDPSAYETVCGVFVLADDRASTRLTRTWGYPWFWSAKEYRNDVYVVDGTGAVRGAFTLGRPVKIGDNVVVEVDEALAFLGIPRPFHGMCYFASRPWDGSPWPQRFEYQDVYVELRAAGGGYAAGILNTIAPLNHEGVTKHHGVKMAAPKVVLGDEADTYFIMINHSSDPAYARALSGQLALCSPAGRRSAWVDGPSVPPFGSTMLDLKAIFPEWREYVDDQGRATLYFSVPPGGVLIPYLYLYNRAARSWAIEHTRPPRHYVLNYIAYPPSAPAGLRKAVHDGAALARFRAADAADAVRRRLPRPVRAGAKRVLRAVRGARGRKP